jgi:predicted site-specific integrase-resolvase
MVKRKVARKTNGRWGFPIGDSKGIAYKESRESKRKRIMTERTEKAKLKSDLKEQKRLDKLQALKRQTEVAEAKYKLRTTERKAMLAHPLGRIGLSSSFGKGKKRRKISWI